MPAPRTSQIEQERARHRASIEEALEEDEDPLAAYDDFIKWTSRTFSESDHSSGLIQLLDEATRKFKDDARYSGDLRYLKLWCAYAKMVEKPTLVYAHLVKKEIGCVYGLLWEEYALALEKEGRRADADKVFRTGVARNARPIERLKKRYRDFQSRPSLKQQSTSFRSSGNSEVDVLRRNPFKNHTPATSTSAPPPSADPSSSTNNPSPAHGRYAPMLAPPAPGKRPEKLRFNLSLLFTPTGVEYSAQEARARSMGLLGKKWGAPSPSELRDSSSGAVEVNFNDDGSRSTQNMGATAAGGKRKSTNTVSVNEPTVTINTKEALADVFGMYNSPDKTVKRAMPGSKHAPVRKIEPIGGRRVVPEPKPETAHTSPRRENVKLPGSAFKPFVDENMPRKENPAPSLKFKPFVDEPKQASVAPTPEAGRRALTLKDSSVISGKDDSPNPSTAKPSAHKGSKPAVFKPISEEPQGTPVFSKPFTPVSRKEPLVRPSQTRIGHDAKDENQGQAQPPSQAFVPLVDSKTPFKVFSRPPGQGQGENAVLGSGGGGMFTPKLPSAAGTGAFKPFVDHVQPAVTSASAKKSNALQPRVPIPPIIEEASTDESSEADVGEVVRDPDAEDGQGVSSGSRSGPSESEDGFAYEGGEAEAETEAAVVSSSDSQFDDDDDYHPNPLEEQAYGDQDVLQEEGFADEDEESYCPPLGGRFGRFNVMTPITERTLEFSTRGFPTPTSTARVTEGQSEEQESGERRGLESGRYAFEVAEKLAREVREQEEDEDLDTRENIRLDDAEPIEERTGTLSLSDSLAIVSSFRPPNPCIPSDPQIVSILLSLLPSDEDYHDLKTQDGGMLEKLQRFAARAARRSGKGGSTDDDDMLISLEESSFRVSRKLGEGGFGAVFAARIVTKSGGDDDDDLDIDEDQDDDDSSLVALKVVKPRSIWEFHVLRRVHRALSAPLKRSIVTPHALYAFRDESYLLLELCPHGSLLDAVNRAGPAGISQQGACLDELLVFFFTIELLRFVEGMHTAGFIHGDLKIDNCLLRLEELPGGASSLSGIYQPTGEGGWKYRGIKIIDFGRTIDTSLFPARQQFVADWPTDDRDCFEIREGRPWTYQTDYFGLVGIVYCMLFGKYIEASSVARTPGSTDSGPIYKIATPFKRYWQTDILTRLFDVLLNPCGVRKDRSLPICEELGSIRVEMERWLQSNCNRSSNTLKGLLKKVELSAYTVQ